jgi:simple sugar transport system permease protein
VKRIIQILAQRPWLCTIIVCVALYLLTGAGNPRFFSVYGFVNLFQNYTFLGIAAVGVTFVILTGGIDLSVGSVVGWATIAMATLIAQPGAPNSPALALGLNPYLSMAIVLAIATLGGVLIGTLIHYFEIPPFLITLAALFLYRGWALVISTGEIPIHDPHIDKLADAVAYVSAERVPLRYYTFLLLAVFALGAWLGRFTAFGRSLLAIGGSENSALLMGLPVARHKILVYAMSGFFGGLAGIVLTIRKMVGHAVEGRGLELEAIAVAVIGGTLLTGGVGGVAGTLVGLLIYGIIQSAMSYHSFPQGVDRIAIGALLLAFILLQKLLQFRRRA